MSDIENTLVSRFSRAIASAFGEVHADTDPLVRPAGNPRFGDYQANVAMSLGKKLGANPREVAERILAALDVADLCVKTEIAGPGFINLHLADTFLSEQIGALVGDERVGVPPADPALRVVVDYSSPNVAKEMHVGHLRSTVIGDCLARVLAFQGHTVIRQNHLGDWGTQFGMLIEHLIDIGFDQGVDHTISDLNALYQAAKKKFDDDAAFAERARQRVVQLQAGDEDTLRLWRSLFDESKRHFNEAYLRLGVLLTDEDIRSESAYNPLLPAVVEDLDKLGQLKSSEGAEVVYPPGFSDREGEPLPLIVRKSDGGFLYATTDLAAIRYRVGELKVDRAIYVTDSRQAQHFAMVFEAARQADFAPPGVKLEHVPFGTVLGKDNKPFKTREGGTVRLTDLIDEAEQRAETVIQEKNADLSTDERAAVARAVGVGALKYADLSSDRIKDYVFDWDRMLSFEGNTAPYLQNAYVRIRSIFRKAEAQGLESVGATDASVSIGESAEHALAVKLLQLPGTIAGVAASLEPHRLCTYLFELAATYHQFYEHCPVLTADSDATRQSRLALSDAVARALKLGLGLLGIDAIERM